MLQVRLLPALRRNNLRFRSFYQLKKTWFEWVVQQNLFHQKYQWKNAQNEWSSVSLGNHIRVWYFLLHRVQINNIWILVIIPHFDPFCLGPWEEPYIAVLWSRQPHGSILRKIYKCMSQNCFSINPAADHDMDTGPR